MSLKDINRSSAGADIEDLGNPNTFFGWALVGFIDLLGFSAQVSSSWSDSDGSPLARLLRIKEEAARIPEGGFLAFSPGEPLDPTRHRARVHTVSDSIALCYALPPDRTLRCMNMAMITVSSAIQKAWAAAIREGYTIRGAVELGQIYWTETETIGPAFNSSFLLESKVARVSRVIVGPVFLDNLLQCMNDDWSQWPASEWLSISHDGLIEISLHNLKSDLKGDLEPLEALRSSAHEHGYRYDHLLEVLRANRFRKADRSDLSRGMTAVESARRAALKSG
jgi:hypothetical protein